MLVKYIIYTFCFITFFFSCNSKKGEIVNQELICNDIYQLAVSELGTYISNCSEKNDYSIRSIIVTDSFYVLTKVDTTSVGDKNYVNLKLVSIDNHDSLMKNDSTGDDFLDTNSIILNYEWSNPLVDKKDFDQLEFNKKINIDRDGKVIYVSLSPPFQQDDKILILAKVYSEKIFFIDEFFVFIEIEKDSMSKFQIVKIFDLYGC